MSRAGPGKRCITPQASERLCGYRVSRHHFIPFGPLTIGNFNSDRTALSNTMANTALDSDFVGFKTLSGPSTYAKPATSKVSVNISGGNFNTSRHTFDDRK
jgi:hypothetical protein